MQNQSVVKVCNKCVDKRDMENSDSPVAPIDCEGFLKPSCVSVVLSDIVSTQGASVRVFKTKWFTRFASKEGIDDAKLVETVQVIESGLVDADYGGGVIKQRIARDGGGKSGGYRSVVAFRSETRSIFMFAFPKSEQENLTIVEKREYKKAAAIYLKMTDAEIALAVKEEKLIEVKYNVEEIQK